MSETNTMDEEKQWTPLDEQDVLNKFMKFKARFEERYSKIYERMRGDRGFLAGTNQWSRSDSRYIAKTRNRMVVNVIANNVNSVSNSYDAWPFAWYTGDYNADTAFDKFLSKPGNSQAPTLALRQSVSFGLGVMCVGSEDNGAPAIYAVPDFERVMLDPSSYEIDGSDMTECALIDYRGKSWVRLHYGDDYVPREYAKNIVPCRRDMVPIVTYYVMEPEGCHIYELVNDRVNDNGIAPFSRIPVFPVYGERFWNEDGEIEFRGLVDKCKDIQRLINYSYTALGERLALSPKPQFVGTVDAFKGLDRYYKDSGSGLNPILPYNRKSLDQKDVLDAPVRADQRIEFQDVAGIIGETLNLMSSVTGVDSKGLADTNQEKTATEVEYTASVFSNNVRHYFTNLKFSFQAMGQFLAEMLDMPFQISVTQGPDERMARQVARQELVTLLGVANENQKPALINAILKSHPDNEILAQTYAELNSVPAPTEMEARLQNMCEQMKQEIEQRDDVIREQLEQIEQYKKSSYEMELNVQAEMQKMQYQHQAKMEEMALQAELDAGKDAGAVEAQAIKNQMEIEHEAAKIDMENQKFANELYRDDIKTAQAEQKAALQTSADIEKTNLDIAKSKAIARQAVENARIKAASKMKPEKKEEDDAD